MSRHLGRAALVIWAGRALVNARPATGACSQELLVPFGDSVSFD